MSDFQNTVTRTARKAYDCNSCYWIREHLREVKGEISFTDLRTIVKLKQKDWKIQPGDRYDYTAGVYDGYWYTHHAFPAAHEICRKYDLYPEV